MDSSDPQFVGGKCNTSFEAGYNNKIGPSVLCAPWLLVLTIRSNLQSQTVYKRFYFLKSSFSKSSLITPHYKKKASH